MPECYQTPVETRSATSAAVPFTGVSVGLTETAPNRSDELLLLALFRHVEPDGTPSESRPEDRSYKIRCTSGARWD